jgi:hypothetical protein
MVEKKGRKNYRFSSNTLRRLGWLARKTDRSETEILETAVQQVFDEEWAKMCSRLIPAEKGWYEYVVGGVPLVKVQEKALAKMGDHAGQMLSEEGGPENLFGLVVLAAGSVPSKMVIHQDNVGWFFDPLHEKFEQIRKDVAGKAAEE